MQYALSLASQGKGHVEPNPLVGAVLVDDDRALIADGYHERYGSFHAERAAFEQAGPDAHGATLFVTLEPCAHHGKQPPCADAVIAAGVSRVVCAMEDPFPSVSGQGIQRIREAGIPIEVGLLAADAKKLNAPFLTRVIASRPYVIAKYAMTLDGKMATATGHSMWISGENSRQHVHQVRGQVDAIIVGAGTALADDPKLTARPPGPRTPVRVVLDRKAESLKVDSALAATANEVPVVVYHTNAAGPATVTRLASLGVDMTEVNADEHGQPDISAALADLYNRGATNVLLEGGAKLLGRFREFDLIDEYHVFVAPKVIGPGLSPMSGIAKGLEEIPSQPNVTIQETRQLGNDIFIRAIVERPWLD